MNLPTLYRYAAQFRALHTNYTAQHNQSPHKFILLLSIIKLYEQDILRDPKIYLTDDLKTTFEREWDLWVKNTHHRQNIGLPLYHMKSEPFWHFHVPEDKADEFKQKNRMKTFSSLQQVVDYVAIDSELCALFRQPESRELLKDVLISRLYHIA